MKYLVAGPTIVNDILLADGSEKQQILGGSVYCVAGIKLWCDDCLYAVSYTHLDVYKRQVL